MMNPLQQIKKGLLADRHNHNAHENNVLVNDDNAHLEAFGNILNLSKIDDTLNSMHEIIK